MRYRRPRDDKDRLGQVFTPPSVAAYVAALLSPAHRSLLELGAGQGALIVAAKERCKQARFTAVEVDGLNARVLSSLGTHVEVYKADVFNPGKLRKALGRRTFGAAIGNPPFGTRRPLYEDLSIEADAYTHQGWLHEDLYFFVETWRRLRNGGELAMILPDAPLTSPSHMAFRRWLLRETSQLTVLELPKSAFVGAEVRSYVVHAVKGTDASLKKVHLRRIADNGIQSDSVTVSAKKAENRMDFTYYKMLIDHPILKSNAPTLGSVGVQVIRGSWSRNAFEALGIRNVHTSSFLEATTKMRLGSNAQNSLTLAEPGDILVPRVGSRCLFRQAYVISGRQPITDAVFRLRAPRNYRRRILDTFAGETGRQWREAHARGSCARYLTVTDLLAMPITD